MRVIYERRAAAPAFSDKEIETLRLAAAGRTNREIAEELNSRQRELSAQTQSGIEQEIKNFVMRYDGVRYAYQLMRAHRNKAEEALRVFHDSGTKEALVGLLDYIISRLY